MEEAGLESNSPRTLLCTLPAWRACLCMWEKGPLAFLLLQTPFSPLHPPTLPSLWSWAFRKQKPRNLASFCLPSIQASPEALKHTACCLFECRERIRWGQKHEWKSQTIIHLTASVSHQSPSEGASLQRGPMWVHAHAEDEALRLNQVCRGQCTQQMQHQATPHKLMHREGW